MFISTTAMLFNVITLWAMSRMRDDQIDTIKRVYSRLYYLETAASYYNLIPLPWEDDLEKEISDKKKDNVLYLVHDENADDG